jgi:hypothetical protein
MPSAQVEVFAVQCRRRIAAEECQRLVQEILRSGTTISPLVAWETFSNLFPRKTMGLSNLASAFTCRLLRCRWLTASMMESDARGMRGMMHSRIGLAPVSSACIDAESQFLERRSAGPIRSSRIWRQSRRIMHRPDENWAWPMCEFARNQARIFLRM